MVVRVGVWRQDRGDNAGENIQKFVGIYTKLVVQVDSLAGEKIVTINYTHIYYLIIFGNFFFLDVYNLDALHGHISWPNT